MSRANANEINKAPLYVRYFFIVSTVFENEVVGITTYRSLKDRVESDNIKEICVIDRQNNNMGYLRPESWDNFLDEWRENYQDSDWTIPYQFYI